MILEQKPKSGLRSGDDSLQLVEDDMKEELNGRGEKSSRDLKLSCQTFRGDNVEKESSEMRASQGW